MPPFPELYEHVTELYRLDQLAQGPLPSKTPRGVTVHYSAERDLPGTVNALRGVGGSDAVSLGYHVLIDREGKATQLTRFSKRVYHAGNAMWRGSSPNSSHIAVALLSYGMLQKGGVTGYASWAGVPVDATEVAQRPNNVDGAPGFWDAATAAQELALLKFLRWCVAAGIDPENCIGHDECALPKGRKVDPGGVLSLSMAQLRELLAPDN